MQVLMCCPGAPPTNLDGAAIGTTCCTSPRPAESAAAAAHCSHGGWLSPLFTRIAAWQSV